MISFKEFGWYLHPYAAKIRAINFLAKKAFRLDDVGLDPDMDPRSLTNAAELSDLFRFSRAIPEAASRRSDRSFVFAWRSLSPSDQSALARMGWLNIVNVDKTKSRAEGSNYLSIGLRGFADTEKAIERSRQPFERWQTRPRVIAFTFSGPAPAYRRCQTTILETARLSPRTPWSRTWSSSIAWISWR